MQIEHYCENCGKKLSVKIHQFVGDVVRIKVRPCNFCLNISNERGHEEGKEQGYSEGLVAGQTS